MYSTVTNIVGIFKIYEENLCVLNTLTQKR